MAKDELVGNMPTENVYAYLQENSISNTIKSDIFHKALQMADSIFPK